MDLNFTKTTGMFASLHQSRAGLDLRGLDRFVGVNLWDLNLTETPVKV